MKMRRALKQPLPGWQASVRPMRRYATPLFRYRDRGSYAGRRSS
ncbi:hypothetical protein OOK60_13980 [Trichothermofontia sichuanensis B231]|nr:hypothetical protein [Trichothermofontia sichuanensis]UZQ53597.1 hypothetical protein OOK60_13980 [Trichothermofontia sichuanensis B231]